MFLDDDEDDDKFNPDEFEFSEPTEEEVREIKKEHQRKRNLPIAKKAQQIFEITHAIIESIDEEKDELHIRESMIGNAAILGAKIAGAEGADLYTLRMENATVIKMHARELLAQTSLCNEEELADSKYLQLLRDEIEEFRILFVEWVNSFDRNNDIPDNWGLFNSPQTEE